MSAPAAYYNPLAGQQAAAASRSKGVRWDEPKVLEQQKESAARHMTSSARPRYSRLATPEDWKRPPVAAYPYMNRYRLIKKMGEGAFSVVYKAVDTKTKLIVGLKLVTKSQLNEAQRTNILREASLLRRIDHPNVIQLVDFHETPIHYALSLELMEGGEIFHQLVDQVCFSENVCRHIIWQVADALRYLHEELGVVHRDIKLENLLYDPIPPEKLAHRARGNKEDGEEDDYIPGVGGAGIGVVKIADFGLSKVVFDATTKTPCGTVGYTAPEILKDQRYSKGVDMWALGCVLYTILSGFPPFFDDDPRGLTEKVANGQFAFLSPWWDDISPESKDLICHLLQVNPNKRYTINQFLAHPWMRAHDPRAAPAPEVVVEEEEELSPGGPTIARYGNWRDLELPDALKTPLDEYYTGTEEMDVAQGGQSADVTGRKVSPPVTAAIGQGPAPGAPPGFAASGAETPNTTYRRLRTPHPVPEGITKEMLAAPFQVYQSIAEGEVRPEHIGMVRGGVVPNHRKGSPLRHEVTRASAAPVNQKAPAQRRQGQGFELDLAHSRLFAKRRHEPAGSRSPVDHAKPLPVQG
ncbi:kinase-like domain-containing protein [Fimicolochytrium jonesii]|uniref:kinase-like domain-containing protein n=1 Tax=Fimicolochytrium jonesii TaxID=1396493 RepID=UPI0022FE271E|nr:kinase-like domain-containing protein [Fimicolochytrium jonesii]KAI8825662.1 kinase-like domain-containing protein [Fimicolochytrium jonesii]